MLSNAIVYVGVNDHTIDLFEGQYVVPNGMAYNSYLIVDEKIALLDTVDSRYVDTWLNQVATATNGRAPDYLIVQHMEPDHSAGIARFAEVYPTTQIVATDKAFAIMAKYFGTDFAERQMVVRDGDTLSLGAHTLSFHTAPMVHWPEVMMTYDSRDKVLFSADAFGKFGALDVEEDWACEARRYFFGIVGKYGMQVQAVLKKLSSLEMEAICPLHGPILQDNLAYYLDLYNTWSAYQPESDGVAIFYTSVYGNTKQAVQLLAEELLLKGCPKVTVTDLAREDMAEAVEDAFRYGKVVLATTTYNAELFPFMRTFLQELVERNYQNRLVGIMENGSWAPMAAKHIRKALENSKNLTFADNTVTIHGAVNEKVRSQIRALAAELV